LWLFELLEDSPNDEVFMAEEDFAFCAALDDEALVAKLSVTAALADRLLLEDALRVAFNPFAVVAEVVFVPAAFVVELPDVAPLVAERLSPAVPALDEVLPPLAELLVFVALLTFVAVPFVPAATVFAVEPLLDVALPVFPVLAVTPRVAASDLVSLFVSDPFAAKAFVVALDLLALLEADEVSVDEAVWLAVACCILVSLELAVSEELCIDDALLVFDLLLLAL
jgi:hypothetical protein